MRQADAMSAQSARSTHKVTLGGGAGRLPTGGVRGGRFPLSRLTPSVRDDILTASVHDGLERTPLALLHRSQRHVVSSALERPQILGGGDPCRRDVMDSHEVPRSCDSRRRPSWVEGLPQATSCPLRGRQEWTSGRYPRLTTGAPGPTNTGGAVRQAFGRYCSQVRCRAHARP